MTASPNAVKSVTNRLQAMVRSVLQTSQVPSVVYGVVTAISSSTLTIKLSGSTATIAGVKYLSTYTPKVNDTAVCMLVGTDLWAVGTIGAAPTRAARSTHTIASGTPYTPSAVYDCFVWFYTTATGHFKVVITSPATGTIAATTGTKTSSAGLLSGVTNVPYFGIIRAGESITVTGTTGFTTLHVQPM